MPETDESDVESIAPGRYTGFRMERVRLTPPGEKRARGGRARLYVRWMPHLGAEAVALYELLRILPDLGNESPEIEELAELLRSTPEGVEASLEALIEARFAVSRDGWLEVAEHPPSAETNERPREDDLPDRDIEVIRAEPDGVSADDYFRFMGSLPAPHILEFLNGYCGRDGLSPDAVREALKIASERDARRVDYVERFEQDRKLRLVEQSGAVRGGALRIREAREGVSGGPDRQSAARRREGYEWLFGETE